MYAIVRLICSSAEFWLMMMMMMMMMIVPIRPKYKKALDYKTARKHGMGGGVAKL